MPDGKEIWLQCYDKVPIPVPATGNPVDVLDFKIILTDRLYNALSKRFPSITPKIRKVKK